jgi:phage shock protein C
MKRKLYRDRFDKKIAGVCGGLAQKFQVDSTIVRILFFALALVTAGLAIFAYLILALILPLGPISYIESNYKRMYKSRRDRVFLGVLGGISEYFRIPSSVLRIIFIILMIFTAIVPLAIIYFILALIIPDKIT